jgi:predicted dehydrogenase
MIRVGMLGLGWWGRKLINAVGTEDTAIRFVAAATRTPAKVVDYTGEMGIDLRDSYDDLLADGALDAIAMATPHTQHVKQVMAALEAGKHVFVEKPLALEKAGAERAASLAAERGLVLAVGFNRRYHPAMIELRQRVADGALGVIEHVEALEAIPVALSMQPGETSQWRADRVEWPAGGMTPMGVHLIDAMIDLFGPIESVYARAVRRAVAIDIEDTASALVDFASGATGYLATMVATRADLRFKVYGSVASAEITTREYDRMEIVPVEGQAELIDYSDFDMFTGALRANLQAFAAAVAGTAEPAIPVDQLVHGVGVLEAIIRSSETGTPQTP